jgi:hypothetical protein
MPRATITDLSNQLFWTRHELAQVKAENRRLRAEAERNKWFRRAANWFIKAKNKQGDGK